MVYPNASLYLKEKTLIFVTHPITLLVAWFGYVRSDTWDMSETSKACNIEYKHVR